LAYKLQVEVVIVIMIIIIGISDIRSFFQGAGWKKGVICGEIVSQESLTKT
jgi:hypothetical protein